jgi:hypothetical protein
MKSLEDALKHDINKDSKFVSEMDKLLRSIKSKELATEKQSIKSIWKRLCYRFKILNK